MHDYEIRTDAGPAPAPQVRPLTSIATADPTSIGTLRATMADTAALLTGSRFEPDGVLQAVVLGARRAVPHLVGAGVVTTDRAGERTAHAAPGGAVEELERMQTDLDEGPAIDALRDAHENGVHAPDLGADARWPRFAPRAVEAGVGEVLSVRVGAAPASAVLTLYGGPAGGLDDRDRLVAALYADQVVVALAGARRVAQLRSALESRDVIGRAKGILMERFGLSDQEAFDRLAGGSQVVNIKLRTVAEWLVSESEAVSQNASPQPETSPG